MKKLFGLIMLVALSLSLNAVGDGGKIGTKGDDLFPWPWGTECPFPWRDIEGSYTVVPSVHSGEHASHYVVFDIDREDSSNLKFLRITEYDRQGEVYAQGRGYSQKDQRIVKGLLKTVRTAREITVMVRSYVKDKGTTCGKNAELVTAITFCPLRGEAKACKSETNDSNYILEKAENRP